MNGWRRKTLSEEKRNYGIDVLRILLGILIFSNHAIYHGFYTYANELVTGHEVEFDIIWALANPAVNCFFIISGYFGIRCTRRKLVSFLTPVYTSAFLLFAVALYLGEVDSIIVALFKSVMPWEIWWFIAAYFILMLLSDFINEALTRMSEKRLGQFILVFTFINVLQGCILQGRVWSNGYSFIQAFNMYIVGRYLKRKNIRGNRRIVLVYCATSIVAFAIKIFSDCFLSGKMEAYISAYSNPIVIMQAVLLFLSFKELKIEDWAKKAVGLISGGTLTIYLLSDFFYTKKYIFAPIISISKIAPPPVVIVAFAVIWYLIAVIWQKLNELVAGRIIRCLNLQ